MKRSYGVLWGSVSLPKPKFSLRNRNFGLRKHDVRLRNPILLLRDALYFACKAGECALQALKRIPGKNALFFLLSSCFSARRSLDRNMRRKAKVAKKRKPGVPDYDFFQIKAEMRLPTRKKIISLQRF